MSSRHIRPTTGLVRPVKTAVLRLYLDFFVPKLVFLVSCASQLWASLKSARILILTMNLREKLIPLALCVFSMKKTVEDLVVKKRISWRYGIWAVKNALINSFLGVLSARIHRNQHEPGCHKNSRYIWRCKSRFFGCWIPQRTARDDARDWWHLQSSGKIVEYDRKFVEFVF